MNKHTRYLNQDQKGFASVAIGLIMIIVLALTTVGFAQLARHEQKSALDKQLSTQAYYAAESGLNDAYKDIMSGKINTGNAKPQDCMLSSDVPGNAQTRNRNIDGSRGVSYSCLMVNLEPTSLKWTINKNASRTSTFSTSASLQKIEVYWDSKDPAQRTPVPSGFFGSRFLPSKTWESLHYPAVLQVTITRSTSQWGLVTHDDPKFTTYLYPSDDASKSTVSFTTAANEQGRIVPGGCNEDRGCKVTINMPPGEAAGRTYLINVVGYYTTSEVTVCGNNCTVKFINGQAEIDVTGKAQNVLKRLNARLSIDTIEDGGVERPNYAIEAQNICKRIKANPFGTSFFSSGNSIDNKICKLDQ